MFFLLWFPSGFVSNYNFGTTHLLVVYTGSFLSSYLIFSAPTFIIISVNKNGQEEVELVVVELYLCFD
jgi:hypothetical protein